MGAKMTLGPEPAADPDATPIVGTPAGAVPPAPPGPGVPGPVGPGPVGPGAAGARTRAGRTWHRFHYAVGVFLIAYGVTGLATGLLLWTDRRDEIEGYFASAGSGAATGVLVLVKAVEAALVLAAVAGVALRRDMLFVPALAGWMAGFAMFAVLDVFTARWGGLAEHLVYLGGFVLLLFLSYGLSAKAQLAGAAREAPDGGPAAGSRGLTRTQEFALQAINRIPTGLTGPRPRPGRND
ncbi:hypothetical protein [Actinomadura chibensis]|uniref:Uncharacterized protein n=1 Tax=Actinomadura chibensis TaxID=392828 RepID=A0A5D0NGS6_9ACTN|nr:hypothetical protein [Actinomadura chibensis]TYB43411.1 hypothetical protein FXF69_26710 [Actinomadura chibensis]